MICGMERNECEFGRKTLLDARILGGKRGCGGRGGLQGRSGSLGSGFLQAYVTQLT